MTLSTLNREKEYMSNEKLMKQYKEHKLKLEDIYSELLQIFHENKCHSVLKNVHVAIFEVNRAIKDLESKLVD